MKNKLSDLNNHLFAELERLGDEELTGEALQQELGRAKAITDVASKVVENAALVLKAEELRYECAGRDFNMPNMLESKDETA